MIIKINQIVKDLHWANLSDLILNGVIGVMSLYWWKRDPKISANTVQNWKVIVKIVLNFEFLCDFVMVNLICKSFHNAEKC